MQLIEPIFYQLPSNDITKSWVNKGPFPNARKTNEFYEVQKFHWWLQILHCKQSVRTYPLIEFWCSIKLPEKAIKIFFPFQSSYMHEARFFSCPSTKTIYCKRLHTEVAMRKLAVFSSQAFTKNIKKCHSFSLNFCPEKNTVFKRADSY